MVNGTTKVDAGPDQATILSRGCELKGTATDDGFPNPPGALTFAWHTVWGPGTVTIADSQAAITTAAFSTRARIGCG